MCNFKQLAKRYWIAIEIALYKWSIIIITIIIIIIIKCIYTHRVWSFKNLKFPTGVGFRQN